MLCKTNCFRIANYSSLCCSSCMF